MTKVESYLSDAFEQLGEHEQDVIIKEALKKNCNTLSALAKADNTPVAQLDGADVS